MLQSRVVSKAGYFQDLRAAVASQDTHFFADTSFLIAACSLNGRALAELTGWLEGLGDRLHVPAWVSHELYGKITNDTDPLTPVASVAARVVNELVQLQAEARRFVDDDIIKAFAGGQSSLNDRAGFLSQLDQEVSVLKRRAQYLKSAGRDRLNANVDILVKLVNSRVIASDLSGSLYKVDAEHAARLVGKHPPGFGDKAKPDNKYGDLIIWREIVEYCAAGNLPSVVLLSNDNKPDWVYWPSSVEVGGRMTPNSRNAAESVFLPLPLLVHELRRTVSDARLSILNLGMLSNLLQDRIDGAFPNLYAAYQLVVAASLPEEDASASLPHDASIPEKSIPASTPAPDFAQTLELLQRGHPGNVLEGVGSARTLLLAGLDARRLSRLGYAMVNSVQSGSEPAELLLRDILESRIAVGSDKPTLVGAMFTALYYDELGQIRDRPLQRPMSALFAVQADPALAGVVGHLGGRLTADFPLKFLLVPDPAVPVVGINISSERRPNGRLLTGLFNREASLLLDAAPEESRSLNSVYGGAQNANVLEFRKGIARHFCVPEEQLRLNLHRSETLFWDKLSGFVDWGPRTRVSLG